MKSESICSFNSFVDKELNPIIVSYSELKRMAKNDEYKAFLCGSDQIWNPLFENGHDAAFYLDFVPDHKKIVEL